MKLLKNGREVEITNAHGQQTKLNITDLQKPEKEEVVMMLYLLKLEGLRFIPVKIKGQIYRFEEVPEYTKSKIFKAIINGIEIKTGYTDIKIEVEKKPKKTIKEDFIEM